MHTSCPSWPMPGGVNVLTCARLTLLRQYRNWFTTVFAWSPRSEHAKANSGISENLQEPSVRVSWEATLKHHRARNGKNNSVNKRVITHPVQLQQWKPHNLWSFLCQHLNYSVEWLFKLKIFFIYGTKYDMAINNNILRGKVAQYLHYLHHF